jgi:RNA polymerase sigma-70 factor (ECF subfamily)
MTRERFICEVRACQGSLRRFLASLCGGDASRADDIAQDALVRAYVNSDGFTGNFKAWLYRIAYNCFIDSTRRTPLPSVDIDSPAAARISAAESQEAGFRREELQRALALIPEKERTAVILHYFEDMPAKDIAAVMHAPIGSVLYWLSSGRKHLKQHIRL